jgi:hypothetical protein
MHRPISLLLGTAAVIAAALPANAMAGRAEGHRDTTLAVYGDAPYFDKTAGSGDQKLQQSFEFKATPGFIGAINADPDVQAVVHVGDIHSGQETCLEDYDRAVFELWRSYRDPLVYTPGDNEWSDCSKLPGQAPATNPWANLLLVRSIFFPHPGHTLGQNPMKVASQADVAARGSGDDSDSAFVENVDFVKGGTLFMTLDIPGGSNNDADPWAASVVTDGGLQQLIERTQRTRADLDWLDRGFATAQHEHDIKQVVIFEQADMWDTADAANPAHLANYEPFVKSIADHTNALHKPVLLINGDTHTYRSDNPYSGAVTKDLHPGYDVPNLHRIVVQGSAPGMEWLKLAIDSGADDGATATSFGPFRWTREPYGYAH